MEFSEPRLERNHKVFLSHSGVQKEFTRHLFKALKNAHHSPFFDIDDDSLRKGEKWYPTLMEAAQKCRLAVLVLSDEFFSKSKWPMMELNEFAKAKNTDLTILPLFLKISWKQFDKDRKEKKWFEKWKAMEADDTGINLDEWKHALLKIDEYSAISYENEGEPAFIEKVVKAICKLVPPDVKYDVPDNQSMGQLCSPILQKLEEIASSPKYNVRVMGLYGMGGVGKTTISRAICNQKMKDFGGKVCHAELGGENLVELQKRILKELTEADSAILDNPHDKLPDLLKNRMNKQNVFLVLDNVWDHQVEEVMMYLNVEYTDGSTVLVTSRSKDLLVQQLHIKECDCLEMPELDENAAVDVFSHYIGSREPIEGKKQDIIRRFVGECSFVKQDKVGSSYGEKCKYHYLPLALKVLGSQLQSISSEVWGSEKYLEKYLEKLEVEKFNLLRERKHPIFSVLRLGYDALCLEDQHILLDLALLWAPKWRIGSFDFRSMWEWMCVIHRKTKDDMKESVNALKWNGLLDTVVEVDELKCNIHDLYIDFAEAESRAGPLKRKRFLLDKEGTNVPFELLKNPSGLCWPSLERLIIHNSKAQSLKRAKLNLCSNVEVLSLYGCEELDEVNVGALENLRSMEVIACSRFGQGNHGLEKLSNLVYFNLAQSNASFAPEFLHSLSSLTALKVLKLIHCQGITAFTLRKVDAQGCKNLRELGGDLSGLKQLEELDVSGCENLASIGGMAGAVALRKVRAQGCKSLTELGGDLSGLKQLEELDVSWCEKLKSLGGMGVQWLCGRWMHGDVRT